MSELIAPRVPTLALAKSKKITLQKTWREFIWLFLFYSILAAALLSPISSLTNTPNHADHINHLAAVIQAKMAFAQGQFPLRTMPVEANHLGYALFQFYSPSSFTFMGFIYWLLTPSNPLLAINLALWCGLLMGGLGMFYLAYWFVRSKPIALLAGIVYLYAPYYIILVNDLGAFQEILALGLLPSVFYFTLQQYYQPQQLKWFLFLSASLYVFFTLHMPTALYGSVLFLLFLTITTLRNRQRGQDLLVVVLTYGFAGLLTAWFLLPAAIFQKYFVISSTYTLAEHLQQFHPTLSNLLFPAAARTIGYKSELLSVHPALGLPILMAVMLAVYAFFNKQTAKCKRGNYFMPLLLLLFFIAFTFVWSPVNVWALLPQPLLMAQYCWRLLGQVIWLGALLFAWSIHYVFPNLEVKQTLIGAILIILCANPWFQPAEDANLNLPDFIKNPHLIYNANAVTINYNKYPTMVTEIDSIQIDDQFIMQLDTPYRVPEALIKFAQTPTIIVAGETTEKLNLSLQVNGDTVERKILPVGKFNWQIPVDFAKNKKQTEIKFINNTTPSPLRAIPIKKFLLTGFLSPQEVMTLEQVMPACNFDKIIKICAVNVPEGVKILELPQFYYPRLLQITLNGKEVAYKSVIHQGQLITFITPQAGKLNTVTIKFQGLEIANWISWLAWAVWLMVLIRTLKPKSPWFANHS